MNLQARILVPIVLLVVLLVSAFGIISYQTNSESLRSAIVDNMRGETEALQRALAVLVADSDASIRRLSDNDSIRKFFDGDIRDTANQAEMSSVLTYYAKAFPDFDSFTLLDMQGKILGASDAANRSVSHADQQYFLQAREGQVYISQPTKNRSVNTSVLIVSAPVRLNNKSVGVLYAVRNLDKFFEASVAPVSVGKSGYAYVLASSGLIAIHKNKDWVLNTTLPTLDALKRLVAHGKGLEEYVDPNGLRTLAYVGTEPRTGMVVVVRAEYDDVFSSLAAMRTNSIIIAIISAVLGSIVVYLVVRPVVRALLQGVNFAVEVAAGNLHNRLHIKRSDELGKLADALNAIPESLVRIVAEFKSLSAAISHGGVGVKGDAGKFSGEYGDLVAATNDILVVFQKIVDEIPTPVVVLTSEEKASYLNNAATALTGKDYKGKSCQELFGREDHNSAGCALRKAYDTGKPAHAETRAHVGGKQLDISYSSIPFLGSDGKVCMVLQLITDLTEIKRAQNTRRIQVVSATPPVLDKKARCGNTLALYPPQMRELCTTRTLPRKNAITFSVV